MAETMRIAVCTGPNHIEVQERPIPPIDNDKVLVRVIICGVCASDLAVWRGSGHKKYPYSPGHEFCGILERTGSDVQALQVGQRVIINPNLGCGKCKYCRMNKPNLCEFLKSRPIKSNGGLSEYVALDHRMVYPLPELLPEELAPFVEPLSCALHVVRRASVIRGERAAIFGAGTMGILTGLVIKSRGCETIFIEPDDERRKQAAELFAVPSMKPEQLTASEVAGNVDVAIDCSGRSEAVSQSIRVVRKAGRILLAGLVMNAEDACLPLMEVTTNELEIKGSWLNPGTFEEAIELAIEHKEILGALTTETFRLDDIALAFERASGISINKVLVRP